MLSHKHESRGHNPRLDDVLPGAVADDERRRETDREALAEDITRIVCLEFAAGLTPTANWAEVRAEHGLRTPRSPTGKQVEAHDLEPCRALREKLEGAVLYDTPNKTLASSIAMRALRTSVVDGILAATEPYDNADLRTFTIIKKTWRFTPQQLEQITAADLKQELANDLRNAGVAEVRGFFVAFLHGEYDATLEVFQLHFHGITTAEKAKALNKLKRLPGYVTTNSGAAPIRRCRVNDRAYQISYTIKAYWPGRPTFTNDVGKVKRSRTPQRIVEPRHVQSLLWLDRQSALDLTVTLDTWSKKSGGTAAWRAFNLIIGRWK